MTEGAPAGPRKLFREEAQSETVQCLSCGAPITLRGFGQIEQVNCAYCGSTLSPDQSGALELLQQAQRQRRPSVLALGDKGKFGGKIDGKTWEVIGIAWRQVRADGETFPWQEFMLFNPYLGYRWLIFGMTDGKWMLGEALDGAPEKVGMVHKGLKYKGERFKHFSTGRAEVTYVEGEFPWQVEVGDRATADDYVAGTAALSVERTDGPEGSELNFTRMWHIDASEVWSTFGKQGSPPSQNGVGLVEPNPHKQNSRFYWLSMFALIAAWLVATFIYIGSRDEKLLLSETGVVHGESVSQTIDVGSEGSKTTLEVEFQVPQLSNAWAYADVVLVKEGTTEALNFGLEADEWHGSDYQEGTNPQSVVVGGVEGGRYVLQVTPQFDPAHTARIPNATYSIVVRQDVALLRYVVLPFLIILFFPFLNLIRRGIFEGRRWQNSDYASES